MVEPAVMNTQLSALNTYIVLEYLRRYERYSDDQLESLIARASEDCESHVRNLKTGDIEEVSLKVLSNEDYWISNRFVINLYDAVQEGIPDPDLGYKIGLRAPELQKVKGAAIGIAILGLEYAVGRIGDHMSTWTKTKGAEVVHVDNNHIQVVLNHIEGITINKFAMDLHKGIFESYARLIGFEDVNVTYSPRDNFEGRTYTFDIKFINMGITRRVANYVLSKLPIVKRLEEERMKAVLQRNAHAQQVEGLLKRALEAEAIAAFHESEAALATQVEDTMHTDLNLLIAPIATFINTSDIVIDCFEDYRQTIDVLNDSWSRLEQSIERVIIQRTKIGTQIHASTEFIPVQDINALLEAIDTLGQAREEYSVSMTDFQDMHEGFAYELERMAERYPQARGLVDDYMQNFQALHNLRSSNVPKRNIRKDVDDLKALANSEYALNGISLTAHVDDEVPEYCTWSHRIQSAWLELVINAWKHNRYPDVTLDLDLNIRYLRAGSEGRFKEDMIVYELVGNGKKISHPEQIFDLSPERERIGVGMYLTAMKFKLNDGIIELTDNDEGNTRFVGYLPVRV